MNKISTALCIFCFKEICANGGGATNELICIGTTSFYALAGIRNSESKANGLFPELVLLVHHVNTPQLRTVNISRKRDSIYCPNVQFDICACGAFDVFASQISYTATTRHAASSFSIVQAALAGLVEGSVTAGTPSRGSWYFA